MDKDKPACPLCGSMLQYEDQWVRNWTCGTLSRRTEAGDNIVESVACLRISNKRLATILAKIVGNIRNYEPTLNKELWEADAAIAQSPEPGVADPGAT